MTFADQLGHALQVSVPLDGGWASTQGTSRRVVSEKPRSSDTTIQRPRLVHHGGDGWVLTTAVVAGLTNALKRD